MDGRSKRTDWAHLCTDSMRVSSAHGVLAPEEPTAAAGGDAAGGALGGSAGGAAGCALPSPWVQQTGSLPPLPPGGLDSHCLSRLGLSLAVERSGRGPGRAVGNGRERGKWCPGHSPAVR